MSKLASAGLVDVLQGKQGGFQINSERAPIYIHEIISLVEDLSNYDRCVLGFSECSDENPCSMHPIWAEKKSEILKIIHETSLDDIKDVKDVKY
jgi:Rrf2 family protein